MTGKRVWKAWRVTVWQQKLYLCTFLYSEVGRRASGTQFDETGKVRQAAEVELVADFGQWTVGLGDFLQHLRQGKLTDPERGILAGGMHADLGKILGSDKELPGIERHGALGFDVLLNQVDEFLGDDGFLTAFGGLLAVA